ncbi:MAG: fibronectin type III domain-containing protein, partial [Pyrinomonadaceae bacterium]
MSRQQKINRAASMKLHLRIALIVTLCALVALAITLSGSAATPSSGTLTPSSGPLTYTSGPFVVPNESGQGGVLNPICVSAQGQICDNYTLTVNAASMAATKNLQVQIQWANTVADYDLYLLNGSTIVGSSHGTSDPETVIVDVPADNTVYTVRIIPTTPLADTVTATISLPDKPPTPQQGAGIEPRYQNYVSPSDLGNSAAEPSIGVDWNPNVASLRHDKVNTGGVAFFTSGNSELRVSFDDATSPAKDVWEDVSSPFVVQSVLSDPIGYVDHQTGRVFQLNLIGGQGNSFMAYSDDDGNSTHPAQGGGVLQGYDHETLGGGPFAPGTPPHSYPNAVYYCSQSGVDAECSLSLDGGQTFGPGVPIFQNVVQCTGGIHGHVKVAPDGTVYVPNASCGAGATVTVSRDGGITWNSFSVPGSTGSLDPSVAVGLNNSGKPANQESNTLYITWVNGDGHPFAAVSRDRGQTWTNIQDVGARFGIQNSNFVISTAGDDNRASVGFLGTPTGGNSNDAATFKGIWHLYVATTYDGGNSWTTVDATPNDPVQVGSMCTSGVSCGSDRNLLDFNDMAVDKEGRVIIAYADGCLAPSCIASSPVTASRADKATIARQSGGRRLFAANDPQEPAAPAAPFLVSATRITQGVDVKWNAPDNGGSPITGYNILRGTASGGETLLATVDASKTTYIDTNANSSTNYFYKVAATNNSGTGQNSNEVSLSVVTSGGNPCSVPGVPVVTDASGDQTILGGVSTAPINSQLDIQSASVAEPAQSDGVARLVFTIKVDNLNPTALPNGQWEVSFTTPDGNQHFVSMDTFGATPLYQYGHLEDDPNTGIPSIVVDGDADSGTFSTDGTISITVSNSKLGAPKAGDTLSAYSANTGFLLGAVVGLVTPIDGTGLSGYTLVGNAFCANPSPTPTPTATPTPSGSPTPTPTPGNGPTCTPPGTKVVDDPANDQTGAQAGQNKSLDMLSVSVAEPAALDGNGNRVDKLTFTVKAADLSVLPANGIWRAFFIYTPAGGAATTYHVSMLTDASKNPTYIYGHTTTGVTTDGNAEAGSYNASTGEIVITISNSKVGGMKAGDTITVYGDSRISTGVVFAPVDSTSQVSYKLVGSSNCTPPATPTPTPVPTPSPLGAALPRYQVFTPPNGSGLGLNSGEPSIGANWKTGKVFFQSDVQTLRASFDDTCPSLSKAVWENKSPATSQVDSDPILFTDSRTGHTVVSMLLLLSGQSESSVTDMDGDVWVPSQGSGMTSGIDHQTVGGGPFHLPVPAGASVPDAVYYCSQEGLSVNGGGYANCALSINGGVTYGPAVPIYGLGQCDGLHGHIKVAPDGTAYVPNISCGGKAAVIYSTDNGVTWQASGDPFSSSPGRSSDPSVGIGSGGTVYFGYVNADGHPRAAVLRTAADGTKTWTDDQDIGAAFGIKNTAFPAAVAGDDDRAAIAFLGSTAAGDYQDVKFAGVWHLYIAHTFDGGKTWTTVDATPNDPVQRGGIWLGGGSQIHRNLLDFMDATVDRQGRVLVGYADGCTGSCIDAPSNALGNSYTALASIARESGGKRLFQEFDPKTFTATAPAAPSFSATKDNAGVHLRWTEPDNGGSAITGYRIYRTNGTTTLLGSVGGNARSYDDPNLPGVGDRFYVTALNSTGESASCGNTGMSPVDAMDACNAPGVQ